MATTTPARKPLGVRATPEQHRILTDAAAREHRSVSSFVLSAALRAAQSDDSSVRRIRTPEEVQAAIGRAQDLMRPYREAGHSLVDELIAERRAEAAHE